MSELIQKHDNRATIRWKLLTGASALALTGYICSASPVNAEDSSHPPIWIELGGQLSRLENGQETFAPALFNVRPAMFEPSQKFERPPLFGLDANAGISFQPENSDWVLSASIRYGRSASKRHVRQQTNPVDLYPVQYFTSSGALTTNIAYPYANKFADTDARTSERHSILDFQVGRDVGLGVFGNSDAKSTVSLGVRFAQFASKSNIALKSNPDWHFNYKYVKTGFPSAPPSLVSFVISNFFPYGTKLVRIDHPSVYHSHMALLRASRSFHGVGPSLSWTASVPFAGNAESSELTFDWGVNAALLFGKQRTAVHHQTTGYYHSRYSTQRGLNRHFITYQPAPMNETRTRNFTVPNVGGSVGISWNYDNAKVSLGYKVDWFFNAIDGGIDAARKEDRGFYGPYASISIGLGD